MENKINNSMDDEINQLMEIIEGGKETEKLVENCVIDTIQVEIKAENMRDVENVYDIKEYEPYITPLDKSPVNHKEIYAYKLNLNTMCGFGEIKSVGMYYEKLLICLKRIGVKSVEEVKLKRIDIAFDSPMIFSDKFKFLTFLFEVCIDRQDRKKAWITTSLHSYKNNTIKLSNDPFDVEFYDKREQSDGRHPNNTRMEFRFKRRSTGVALKYLEKNLKSLLNKLEDMEGFIPMIEINVSKQLIKLWNEEKETVTSLSEFVRKYDNFIYTRNILKTLYENSGLNGSFDSWIKSYKKANKIELYTKSDITKIKKEMIKELKKYMKI